MISQTTRMTEGLQAFGTANRVTGLLDTDWLMITISILLLLVIIILTFTHTLPCFWPSGYAILPACAGYDKIYLLTRNTLDLQAAFARLSLLVRLHTFIIIVIIILLHQSKQMVTAGTRAIDTIRIFSDFLLLDRVLMSFIIFGIG